MILPMRRTLKMENNQNNHYDAIVVGSGIGGLTASSLLSQIYNKKVLVLERHGKLGGFTHTFSRKNFTWDVGLHYVGQLQKGHSVRKAFDFITQHKVNWLKMKSPFERFCYPDFTLDVPDNLNEYKKILGIKFPHHTLEIEKYFNDIHRIPLTATLHFMPSWLKKSFQIFLKKRIHVSQQTLDQYLKENISDLRLRSVLSSQWGDYGLPPSQASFLIHAIIVKHYLDGAYYPEGGAKVIAQAIEPIVKEREGQLMVRKPVHQFLVDHLGQVTGVKVHTANGSDETYYAPLVFSNMGVENTFKLVPPQFLPENIQNEVHSLPKGTSAVTLFVGFKSSPEALGIHGQNYWIYNSWDHENIWKSSTELLKGKANHCYISFPSLKNPQATAHTAEIIAFVPNSAFQNWSQSEKKNRPLPYTELKEIITEGLLQMAEEKIPGFKNLIDYVELGTPLTFKHYTHHPHAQIYGIPATPARAHLKSIQPKTPIKGLYLVGADVGGHGIVGAMMGGILGVSAALGWSTFKKVLN